MPKTIVPLNAKAVANAKKAEKSYKLYDGGGLVLLVRPTGTKVWQLLYKFEKQPHTYSIGQYPAVSLVEARQERERIKKLLKDGINPNQHKQSTRTQNITESKNTFESVARDWYSKKEWAAKHAKNVLSRLEKDVFKEIGSLPIASVTVPHIISILKKIEKRGALDVAQRINQYCSEIFEYAISQGLCEMNPAAGRTKFIKKPERKNRKHLKEDELGGFLLALEEDEGNPLINLLVKLAMHTFLRPGEVRAAKWEEIDEANAMWTIPAERMKKNTADMQRQPHLVPLSKQALAIIKEIRKLSSDSDFLFPGKSRHNKPLSDVAIIKAVKRLSDGKATPHGFRHTASTILNEQGFPRHVIDKQMSHVDRNKVRAVYNKAEYLEDRKNLMQSWANHLSNKLQSAA